MLFERVVVKHKEVAAIPDGDVIRVIERVTRDNGRRGKNRVIYQKKRVSIVDRKTGKRIGRPTITEQYLEEMPAMGEAIWDVYNADTEMQIKKNVREILNQKADEEEKEKPVAVEDEVAEEFHRALKKATKPETKKAEETPAKPKKEEAPANYAQRVPDVWWLK